MPEAAQVTALSAPRLARLPASEHGHARLAGLGAAATVRPDREAFCGAELHRAFSVRLAFVMRVPALRVFGKRIAGGRVATALLLPAWRRRPALCQLRRRSGVEGGKVQGAPELLPCR